jgi:uncharacterized protein YutD
MNGHNLSLLIDQLKKKRNINIFTINSIGFIIFNESRLHFEENTYNVRYSNLYINLQLEFCNYKLTHFSFKDILNEIIELKF